MTFEDLDETMSATQQSQFMQDKFPPQGRSTDRTQVPKNDAEMLTFLMTQAKNSPEITRTLGLIKTTVTYEQNLKNMTKSKMEELRITYAYLRGVEAKD